MSDKTGAAGALGRFKWSEHSTGLGFALLFVLAIIVSWAGQDWYGWPSFLTWGNLTNIVKQASYTGIIGLGMTLIIISGGIDLSVGSMMAFVGGITIFLLNLFPVDSVAGTLIAVAFCLAFGAFCGFVNGFMVTTG
ncbi:MAG: ribose ABC transporter permease, partial [Treponema sp.]|nr:ribose ABC transporter permease [Treponema sp.]